jgi:ammonia channel protein AmtB
LLRLRIDDPLDSSVVHFVGGALGVLLNGAFARPEYVAALRTAAPTAAGEVPNPAGRGRGDLEHTILLGKLCEVVLSTVQVVWARAMSLVHVTQVS